MAICCQLQVSFVDDHSYSAAQRISAMSIVCALVTDGLKDENVINNYPIVEGTAALRLSLKSPFLDHPQPLRGNGLITNEA